MATRGTGDDKTNSCFFTGEGDSPAGCAVVIKADRTLENTGESRCHMGDQHDDAFRFRGRSHRNQLRCRRGFGYGERSVHDRERVVPES